MPIEWQPYGPMVTYPHLLPADSRLWHEFVITHPGFYDEVAYDTRVGEGEPVPPDLTPPMAYMWYMLTTRRVDVIGRIGTDLYIIEIKPLAGMSCVGQLVGYQILFHDSYPAEPIPSMIAITDILRRDINTIFLSLGITSYLVSL